MSIIHILSKALPQRHPRIRVGIIGLGNISTVHIAAILASRDAVIYAIADVDTEKLNKKIMESRCDNAFTDYHKILQDPNVDMVDILLPHERHAEVVCEVLAAGKHVLCEKPLVTNVRDISRIQTLARKMNRHVYIKQYFRFSVLHKQLQKDVANGVIGRPYLVSCLYTTNDVLAYNDPTSWRGNVKEAGGGIWMDVGVHIIDYLQELFGDPLSVFALTKRNFSPLSSKGEDLSAVTVEFDGGIVANILCSASDTSFGFRWEKRFFGSEGSIHLTDSGKFNMRSILQKNGKEVAESTEQYWWKNANIKAIQDVLGRIARDEPPAISLEEARRTLEVVSGAYISARTGRKIRL